MIKELVSRRTQAQQDRHAIEGGGADYLRGSCNAVYELYARPKYVTRPTYTCRDRQEHARAQRGLTQLGEAPSEGFELVVVASRAELARDTSTI